MKKFVLFFIITILVGFIVGWYVYENKTPKEIGEEEIIISKETTDLNQKKSGEEAKQASTLDTKISPNAILVTKKYYKGCKHIINEYEKVSEDLVNMTIDEFKNKFPDWDVQAFSEEEIIIYKKFEGNCSEHYVVREKDGFIAIYGIDENKKEVLKQITTISIDYLTQTDLIKIKNGIYANGREKLNSILEDFE